MTPAAALSSAWDFLCGAVLLSRSGRSLAPIPVGQHTGSLYFITESLHHYRKYTDALPESRVSLLHYAVQEYNYIPKTLLIQKLLKLH